MKILLWVIVLLVIGVILFYMLRKVKGADTTSMQKELTYGPQYLITPYLSRNL